MSTYRRDLIYFPVPPPSVCRRQDLLYQLGDISPVRVRTWPAAGHATVKDLVALNERKNSKVYA